MKKIISLIVVICMMSMLVLPISVSATDINDPAVFIKQQPSWCTWASIAMMMRRQAILDGNSNWSMITDSYIHYSGGLRNYFTSCGYTIQGKFFSDYTTDNKSYLINLLNQHPEGIACYMFGDNLKTHAVLVTDYNASEDMFYCADSANGYYGSRRKITTADLTGGTSDQIVKNFKKFWYISGGTCNLTGSTSTPTVPSPPPVHTHSYSYAYESSHPHSQYKYCSCGDRGYTGANQQIASCKQCYPLGNVKLTRSVEKAKGNATFYRNNVANANSYILQVRYENGGLYGEYNMNQDTYTVKGIPSGEYYAVLYAKNNSTGEQRNTSCDIFKITEKYDIVFNANGGTNAPSNQIKYEDTPLTLTTHIPTKEGHIFKGWASSKNATEAQYQAGGSYTKNAKITLYAVWEPEIYTVTFDTNDGIGTVDSEKVTYGNTIKMPNSIIKDYAYLKGWSVQKNSTNIDYALNTDYKIKQNLALYAVWGDASWDSEISLSLSGKGTQEEPYLISTAADLAYLANKVNTQTSAPNYEYYKLTDNINLNYNEWKPIGIYGNENQYFYGSFDGNGYTISDMYITDVVERYVGLFGYVKDSEIKNLTVTGAIESISATSNVHIGGIVGYAAKTNIENIDVKYFNIADISAVFENNYVCARVGAVVGYASQCEITDCSSTDCHIDIKDGSCTGGMIVGFSTDTNISYCTVDVSKNGLFSAAATANCLYLGGVCGEVYHGVIEKCNVTAPYFSNNIKAVVVECGGIAGDSSSGTIRFCAVNFTDKTVNSITTESDHESHIGGIVGYAVFSPMIVDCKYDGSSISASCNSYGIDVGGIVGNLYAHSLNDNEAHINRCIANISGTLSGKALVGNSKVGGAIGLGNCFGDETGVAKNIIVISNGINSYASRSGDLAYAGNAIGYNQDNVISIEKAYYNTEMNVTSSTGNIDTTGTARSKNTMNISFYKNVMGFETYSSMENLKTNENAVWVLKNGELPELYYNCLNDITISGDIENGTVTLDKAQAVDGEVVTVTAAPNENYVLNKVYVNGEEQDGSTFIVSGDSEVYVTFAEKIPEYNISVAAGENAAASLTNLDAAEAEGLSLMSAETSLMANDGEEIQVAATADADYTVDTIYVNGEEIAGDSFILTEDSVVTMEVASISTAVAAVTNDAEYVEECSAILSGSVSESDGAVRYIRYWQTDNPTVVYTTEVQDGAGDYMVDIIELEANTQYSFQMTENGEIKTFTTQSEEGGSSSEDTQPDNSTAITNTTYNITDSEYEFSIEPLQTLETEMIVIGVYNVSGRLLAIKRVACNGDTLYTASFPINDNIKYAKVFTFNNMADLKPIGGAETVTVR